VAHIRRLLTPEQKRRQRRGELPEDEEPKGKWQASVRHPSGKQWSKSDHLKGVVKEWAKEQERAMHRGEFIDPNQGKVTLTEWREKWLKTRRVEVATDKKNTSHWTVHLEPKFGKWPINSIQSWDVEEWLLDMQARDVGATTVAAAINLLKAMLNGAVKHRVLQSNPTLLVDVPPVPAHKDRFLSREEAEILCARFTGQNRLLVEFLLYTGLRWGEAAALDGRDVNLMRKQIHVHQGVRRDSTLKGPKTDAGTRYVPLTTDLTEKLSRHIRDLDAPVFRQDNGKRIGYSNWRSRVWSPAVIGSKATKTKPAVKGAGLANPQPTIHDLRHTYGSWLGEAKVPVHEIAALMGHSDWRMAQRYVHATDARHDRARDALERQQSGTSTDLHGTP
jgi:integrase